MPRRKLSEYRAKHIVSNALLIPYVGWSVSKEADLSGVEPCSRYVVKVDQAVKGRYKKGLVLLDIKKGDLKQAIKSLAAKGYDHFLIEPYKEHKSETECYLSVTQDRNGCILTYSEHGGIEIESNRDTIKQVTLSESTKWTALAHSTGINKERLKALWRMFTDEHMVFLEINPYVVNNDGIDLLDCAIEVDGAGAYYSAGWSEDDVRTPRLVLTDYEKVVYELDSKSPASFNLSVLNENGGIFLLLSGGGASVVVADEVYNRGYGDRLANYGEYSGNPTMHETYLYTKEVFKLLLASAAPKKVLFIGGAVANFTDIANTFNGVIQAIDEYADELKKQKVKIFVRRGGPRQEIGLAKMDGVLDTHGLLGGVYDPSTPITEALGKALEEVAI